MTGVVVSRCISAAVAPNTAPDVLIFWPGDLPLPVDRRIHRETVIWPASNPLLRAFWEEIALLRYLAVERAGMLFCLGVVVATKVSKGVKIVTMFRNMIPFDSTLAMRCHGG